MWQKARLIDPDFLPVSQQGREFWVRGRPYEAEYQELKREGEQLLSEKDTTATPYRGLWMMTNLMFPDGRCCRVWQASIELLNEFSDGPAYEDVNTRELLSEIAD